MHALSGGCHCGNMAMDIELSRKPGTFRPRACDCDFCRLHGAAYISDAEGSLRFRIKDERTLMTYRQGSKQAEFLLCGHCGVVLGVLYRDAGRRYAAVNANCVDAAAGFGPNQPMSPQALPAEEKARRWRDLWFSRVEGLA